MKIRTDFVTNSSSSSFITCIVRKKDVAKSAKQTWEDFAAFINELIDKYGMGDVPHNTYGCVDEEYPNLRAEPDYIIAGENRGGSITKKGIELIKKKMNEDTDFIEEFRSDNEEELRDDYEGNEYLEETFESFDKYFESEAFDAYTGYEDLSFHVSYAYDNDISMEKYIINQLGGEPSDEEKAELKKFVDTLAPYITVNEFGGGTD